MKLSIVSSNLNRLDPNSNVSKLFLKSVFWQKNKDIELVIADGGSSNFSVLQKWFDSQNKNIPIRLIKTSLKDGLFSRGYLNNVGIKQAQGEYIMTTDVDIMFSPLMTDQVLKNSSRDTLVEARTLYWKQPFADQVYSGKVNVEKEFKKCYTGHGRIKYRTTAGGCQCMHRDNWHKLRGYDERYKVWGSEDASLIIRATLMGLKEKWICEERENIILFHQPHLKSNAKLDLEWQEKNKKILLQTTSYIANENGWGETV